MPMKVTLQTPELTSRWIVEAHGHSLYGDADNREQVYCGADEAIAKRTYLEVLALSQAYRHGRVGIDEYSYSRLVLPLFADLIDIDGCLKDDEIDRNAPFAWAAYMWSRDEESNDGLDATIRGVDLFWVDEHGAKLSTQVALSSQERVILDNVPAAVFKQPYPIQAIMAKFLALDLLSEIADPMRTKGPPSL